MLYCSKCGKERNPGRKMCDSCYKEYKREYAKKHYLEYGRYMFTKTCEACGKQYQAYKKTQRLCRECYYQSLKTNFKQNSYKMNKRAKPIHRVIAESILKRTLHSNEVVHHLDCNVQNNDITNLLIITRRQHTRLHSFLRTQRVILEKSNIENFENCWNTLIVPMTTTWLETANVKVIKLWEIGQSAAETLPSTEDE